MADPRDRAQSILLNALEIDAESERAAYVQAECGGDEDLRREVEQLLDHAQRLGRFLDGGEELPKATLDQPITEAPGTIIGPYKLRQPLGEGGFGVVFAAEQEEPVRRLVVLKVIKPGMDTREVIARFEAERQALAVMDHPNIAKVLDAGKTESGRPYFVMELVKGYPITEYCDARHLTPRERLELFVPVCQAVQHAHHKGIIHRDIKPSNVMIAEYDDRPVPKVIDFGVAKAIDQRLTEKTVFTQIGQVVGTLDYMSPEQAKLNELDVDTRSDVYSLGVLLYELLAGETPFDRERLRAAAFDEILRIIREEDPPLPSLRLSGSHALPSIAANRQTEPKKLTALVRGELDWIVMKALEKDRNRRYETANAVAEDVRHYLADEPVHACPPSMWYQMRKFARRKSGALVMAVVIVIVVLVAVGGISATIAWSIRDQNHRRNLLANRVELALEEVEKHEHSQDWNAARQASERAQTLVSGVEGLQELKDRILRHQRDLEFVAELQEIRSTRSITTGEAGWKKLAEREDAVYADVFRRFGIDVLNVPHEEAVRQLKSHAAILPAISVILDDWASSQSTWKKDPEGAARLWRLANAVDSDPWRNKLREALIRQDAGALKELAGSGDLLQQPPTTLWLLATNLAPPRGEAIDRSLGIELLQNAQQEYPADFWLNYYAGYMLMNDDAATALPYMHGAHVLRPRVYAAHHNLAFIWMRAGSPDRAIAEFKELLVRHPNFWWPNMGIASAYEKQGSYEEALKHFQAALDAKPPRERIPILQLNIASAHHELNHPHEAVEWYRRAMRDAHVFLGDRPTIPVNTSVDRRDELARAYFQRLLVGGSELDIDVRPALLKLAEDHPQSETAWSWLFRALTKTGFHRDGNLIKSHSAQEHVLSSRSLCEAAYNRDRENPTACRALASVLDFLRDYPAVLRFWWDVAEADPESTLAHLQLAAIYSDLERWSDTLTHLRAAQRQEPENPDVLGRLCELLSDCPDSSLRNPQEGLAIAAGHDITGKDRLLALAHFRNSNWRDAQQVQARSLAQDTPSTDVTSQVLAQRYLLAMAHWSLDDQPAAMEWFLAAVLPPQIPRKDLRLVHRYHREAVDLIPPDAIVAECTQRLEDSGERAELFLARGEALARMNDFEAAVEDFSKAIELIQPGKFWKDPRRIVYQRLAEFPGVVDLMAASRPGEMFWIELARHHALFGRWQEARGSYERVFEESPRVAFEYAGVLLLADHHEAYQGVCRRIAGLWEGSDGPLHKRLLPAAVSLGPQSGIELARQIEFGQRAVADLKWKPGAGRQGVGLGMAHFRAGEFKTAVQAFQDAAYCWDGPVATTAFGMAMAHHQMANEEESQRWYDYAVMLHEADGPCSSETPARLLNVEE